MKQVIIFAMMLIFSATSFSQETSPSKPLTKADYIHKSKSQKTAAFISLGVGATIFAIAAPGNIDFSTLGVLVVIGAVATLASIPLFISAAKNKRKASNMSASLRMENADVFQGYTMAQTYYPALSVKINF